MAEVGTAPQPQTHTSHSWMAVRNVLSNWGAYGLSIVITFFLSPFVVHRLGDAAYGVWVLIASLTGYLGLLDMGVRAAVTRYIPNFHTQGEHEESSRIVSSALALFAAAGLIAILLCCSVAFFALQYLHIPMHLWNGARIVLVLAGVSVALSLISGVFGGVVIGLQRFDLYNGVGTAAFVLRSVAIVLVLLHGYGLVALAVVQLSYALVSLAVNMLTSIRLYPELRPALSLATRTHLKTIFSFSVYAFALNVFSYVILYTDSLVIAAMLPVSLVTFFSIAANLVSYARQLVGGITTTVGPLASRLEASGDSKNLQEVTLTTSRYAGTLVMTIFFTFLMRGGTFIGLWMGKSYVELSGRILVILGFGFAISAQVAVAWAVMFGIGKHKALVPAYLAESLTNLVLSILLVRAIGVTGTAWGTTIPSVMVCLLFWPWYVRRTLHIPMRSYAANTWVRPAIACIPFVICTYGFMRWTTPSNVYVFFLQTGVALIAGAVGFWIVCVSAADRKAYMERIRRLLDRTPSRLIANS